MTRKSSSKRRKHQVEKFGAGGNRNRKLSWTEILSQFNQTALPILGCLLGAVSTAISIYVFSQNAELSIGMKVIEESGKHKEGPFYEKYLRFMSKTWKENKYIAEFNAPESEIIGKISREFKFDKKHIQANYRVYPDVCRKCHELDFDSFKSLQQLEQDDSGSFEEMFTVTPT